MKANVKSKVPPPPEPNKFIIFVDRAAKIDMVELESAFADLGCVVRVIQVKGDPEKMIGISRVDYL